MKCPKCGNEVNQDEAFCGQCGTPMKPPSYQTEMVQAPRSGQLNSYNPNNPAASNSQPTFQSGMVSPPQPTPNQASGFYQDATEAMSVVPPGYPQQGFAGTPAQGGYPGSGQYNPQVPPGQPPFQASNYTQHGFPQTPQFQSGQGYGYPAQPQQTPTPQKERGNTALIIASIFLVIALIAVVGFGALYLTRNHNPTRAAITPTAVPTSAPTPTAIPSPSPTATATPTPVPSPTAAPTAAPDANFSWCTTACTTNGYIVEYPNGWNEQQTSDKTGTQFFNPSQTDTYAAFKTPGPTTSTASNLVAADLQTGFASQPGYAPPTSTETTTIGGENWTYAIAHYTFNSQLERIEVFATVHQGKAYIIELQAADSQFDSINTQYFAIMIGRFQFQQSAS